MKLEIHKADWHTPVLSQQVKNRQGNSVTKNENQVISYLHHPLNTLNAPLLTASMQPYWGREAISGHLCMAVLAPRFTSISSKSSLANFYRCM